MRLYRPASTLRRETFAQFGVEPRGRQVHGAFARDDEIVYAWRQRAAAAPEKLSYLPFDPVTDH